MKENITMSKKEVLQIEIVEKLVRKEIRQKTVANLLELSIRQVQRKIYSYKLSGVKGLVHKSRGKVSNNKIPQFSKCLTWSGCPDSNWGSLLPESSALPTEPHPGN